MPPLKRIEAPPTESFGPLPPSFHWDLNEGYTALIGANNSGKTALLQLAFRQLFPESEEFGAERICLVLADRPILADTTETAGDSLGRYNSELRDQLTGVNLISYMTYRGPGRENLARLLLNHYDFQQQLGELQELLGRLGLPRMRLQSNQAVHFDDVRGYFQGSGLRSVFPVVCALTDPSLRVILVDEPEVSLEPTLQKALKNLLIEKATETEGKAIVVTTHSHLFTHRASLPSNHRVIREHGTVRVEPVEEEADLFEVVFGLLGNSTEDLFFPQNYLIVEGGSDQEIVEKALVLLGGEPGQVKVLSASGIDSVRDTMAAVETNLLPLIVHDSPYKGRVVAMVDKPRKPPHEKLVDALEGELGERLVVLDKESIEDYLPDELYEQAELSKTEVLEKLEALKVNFRELQSYKGEVARAVAEKLTVDDLDRVQLIKQAVEKALATD